MYIIALQCILGQVVDPSVHRGLRFPAQSELLFTGSGHTYVELCGLADASQKVPRFALPLRLKGSIAATRSTLSSPNVVAQLTGSDSKLRKEYVVVSAHLDHLGVGAPMFNPDGKRVVTADVCSPFGAVKHSVLGGP